MTVSRPPADPHPADTHQRAYERRWWVLAILCASVFLVVVDNLIINVALPTLQRELDASVTSLQWIVDAYALVFACLLLAGGGRGANKGVVAVWDITTGERILTAGDELDVALADQYRLERELSGAGMSRVFVAEENCSMYAPSVDHAS